MSKKEELKIRAVQLVREQGMPMIDAAKELSVSRQTLHTWMSKAFPGEYQKVNYSKNVNLFETWVDAYANKHGITDRDKALIDASLELNTAINASYSSSKFGLFRRADRPLPDAVRFYMQTHALEYAVQKSLKIKPSKAMLDLFLSMITSPEVEGPNSQDQSNHVIKTWFCAYFDKHKSDDDKPVNAKKMSLQAIRDLNEALNANYDTYKIGVFSKRQRPLPEVARVFMQDYVIEYVVLEVFKISFTKKDIQLLSRMIATP